MNASDAENVAEYQKICDELHVLVGRPASRRYPVDIDIYLYEFDGAVSLLAHYQEFARDPAILNLFYDAWLAARRAAHLPHELLFCTDLINFELEILTAHDITLIVYAQALSVCWQWQIGKIKLALTQ